MLTMSPWQYGRVLRRGFERERLCGEDNIFQRVGEIMLIRSAHLACLCTSCLSFFAKDGQVEA